MSVRQQPEPETVRWVVPFSGPRYCLEAKLLAQHDLTAHETVRREARKMPVFWFVIIVRAAVPGSFPLARATRVDPPCRGEVHRAVTACAERFRAFVTE